jgi:predicted lipoprotein with Yx(FWY)xxD motif
MRKCIPRKFIPCKFMPALLTAICLCIGADAAFAQSVPATAANTVKGNALVDGKGMTLYVFDRDNTGKSNCNGTCAAIWPPFAVPADGKASADWSVVNRDDGSKQWAHKGKPLYTFSKDAKPGDANGDGVNNVWHIAAP